MYQFWFHLDHHVNQLIVKGQWRNLHDDEMHMMDKLTHLIADYYKLQEDVKGRATNTLQIWERKEEEATLEFLGMK
jgi:hypothetical protein